MHKGDTVILSSRFIPGNVRAITRLINRLYKLGAEVLYEQVQAIHASGHAHGEELRVMLTTVAPKFFIPVHGEYRHLVKHSRLAVSSGVAPERALVIEDGQPVTFFADGGIRLEEAIPVEHIYVDGKGVGDVGVTVLKERQLLAGEGLVIVVLVVDEKSGELSFGPNILSKGFVFEQPLQPRAGGRQVHRARHLRERAPGPVRPAQGTHPLGLAAVFPQDPGTRPGGGAAGHHPVRRPTP